MATYRQPVRYHGLPTDTFCSSVNAGLKVRIASLLTRRQHYQNRATSTIVMRLGLERIHQREV